MAYIAKKLIEAVKKAIKRSTRVSIANPKDLSNPTRPKGPKSKAKSVESKEVKPYKTQKGKSTIYLKEKEKERAIYKNKGRVIKAKSNKKGKGKKKANNNLSRSNKSSKDQIEGDYSGLDTNRNPLFNRFITKSKKALIKSYPPILT